MDLRHTSNKTELTQETQTELMQVVHGRCFFTSASIDIAQIPAAIYGARGVFQKFSLDSFFSEISGSQIYQMQIELDL